MIEAVQFCLIDTNYFAPSALHKFTASLTQGVALGYYTSRLWRLEPGVFAQPHRPSAHETSEPDRTVMPHRFARVTLYPSLPTHVPKPGPGFSTAWLLSDRACRKWF